MRAYFFTTALLPLVLLCLSCTGVLSSFLIESQNYPQYFIRHNGFRIELWSGSRIPPVPKEDFLWTFVFPALNGNPNCYSILSSNMPNYYMRQRNFELWLDPLPSASSADRSLFNLDSSFCEVATNNGFYKMLQSVNYPNRYWRHQNFQLFLQAESPSDQLFVADSQFLPQSYLGGQVACPPGMPYRVSDVHLTLFLGDDDKEQDTTFNVRVLVNNQLAASYGLSFPVIDHVGSCPDCQFGWPDFSQHTIDLSYNRCNLLQPGNVAVVTYQITHEGGIFGDDIRLKGYDISISYLNGWTASCGTRGTWTLSGSSALSIPCQVVRN